MSDIIDRAQRAEETFRERALKRRSNAKEDALQTAGEDGWPICIDCGERIPKARLAARPNAVRCIECQRDHEKRTAR